MPNRSRYKKWRQWSALIGCALFLVAAGGFESLSERTGVARGYLVSSASGGRNAAVAQAAGEFRIVAANILWSNVVENYHHRFMATGGDWSKNESLLPLLKTIIELDPHFTQAYEIMGGEILPRTGREPEGKAVLRRGIQNNPNDWELYRSLAMLYAWRDRDPTHALPYAQAALANAKQLKDDDGFAEHLMTKLCHTLNDEIKDQKKTPLPPA